MNDLDPTRNRNHDPKALRGKPGSDEMPPILQPNNRLIPGVHCALEPSQAPASPDPIPAQPQPKDPKKSALRMVIYGQGSTAHRDPTLLRVSNRLKEEVMEVAQGQFYLIVEQALRRLVDDLKRIPEGEMIAVSAKDMIGEPALNGSVKRAGRPRKAKTTD